MNIKQIMAEYDAAKDDAEFDSQHPIFQMAQHIDNLQTELAERDRLLREAMHVLEFTVHNLSNLDITYEYTKAEHEVLGKIREVIGE